MAEHMASIALYETENPFSCIPIIDLGKAKEDRGLLVQEIMEACDEYAGFQVINHGVSEKVMKQTMEVVEEFFSLGDEEKEKHAKEVEQYKERGASFYSSGVTQYFGNHMYRSSRDVLRHPTSPGGDDEKTWPRNPPKYKEIMRSYSEQVRKLSKVILGLIGEGLGLEAGFFDKELKQGMLNSRYPASSNSTMGVGRHCDPNLITFLQQNVYGLQLLKDGNWLGVQPIPNAFFVNVGLSLTAISNGKLRAVAHRAVSHTSEVRTSLASFIYPQDIVEPAKSLVGPNNPPLFKCFNWLTEFMPHYNSIGSSNDEALDLFRIPA